MHHRRTRKRCGSGSCTTSSTPRLGRRTTSPQATEVGHQVARTVGPCLALRGRRPLSDPASDSALSSARTTSSYEAATLRSPPASIIIATTPVSTAAAMLVPVSRRYRAGNWPPQATCRFGFSCVERALERRGRRQSCQPLEPLRPIGGRVTLDSRSLEAYTWRCGFGAFGAPPGCFARAVVVSRRRHGSLAEPCWAQPPLAYFRCRPTRCPATAAMPVLHRLGVGERAGPSTLACHLARRMGQR